MKKSKMEEYWQKRAVKAELVLITIKSIASVDGDEHGIALIVSDYFNSVAAGEVKDTQLPDAASSQDSKEK